MSSSVASKPSAFCDCFNHKVSFHTSFCFAFKLLMQSQLPLNQSIDSTFLVKFLDVACCSRTHPLSGELRHGPLNVVIQRFLRFQLLGESLLHLLHLQQLFLFVSVNSFCGIFLLVQQVFQRYHQHLLANSSSNSGNSFALTS